MFVESVRLINYGPFAGDNVIHLKPTVYAITAKDVDNPKRSNWLGKTTFLEAIPFALYGVHSKASSLISHGMTEGGVIVTLSNGAKIKRILNKSKTTLTYSKIHDFTGKEAQERIVKDLGLDRADFFASCFVQQKQLSRLVLCQPSERFAIVASWLSLERLQQCEQAALEDSRRNEARTLGEDMSISNDLNTINSIGAMFNVKFGNSADTLNTLQLLKSDMETRLSIEKNRLESLASDLSEQAVNLEKLAEDRGSLKSAEDKLLSALAHIESAENEFEKSFELKYEHISRVIVDTREQISVAQNLIEDYRLESAIQIPRGFQGDCPITSNECPAKNEVKNFILNAKARSNQLQENIATASKEKDFLEYKLESAMMIRRRHEIFSTNAVALREEIASLRVKIENNPASAYASEDRSDIGALRGEYDSTVHNIATLQSKLDNLVKMIGQVEILCQSIKGARERLHSFRKKADVARYAALAFGKQGAQRIVAERALEYMESRANAFLQDADIPLSIQVKWTTELDSLSSQCYSCGRDFPKGKIMECPSCGKERRNKVSDKLTFDLSDRSGAAEDLAGIAFQIAASQYLKDQRGSMFGSLMLDEPFGHLDEHNRNSLVTRFLNVISLAGFEQSFIVAHHNNISESMPGKIEISAKNRVSSLRVVHG
ncbi:MAG: hypothetical protein E6R03_10785 [Hyphomicrobiaceae bacterium]|nr:MAG: hypothetical protein E6R03_10785 [Hyphomicrobiaceae bacterium]